MKKSISAYICLAVLAILFTACGTTPATQTTSSSLLHNGEEQNTAVPTASAAGQDCEQAQTATPTSTPSAQAQAKESTDKTLATGRVAALPQCNLLASILSASQPADSSITHKHVASFVYQVNGTQTIQEQGGAKQTLNPGDAIFIRNDVTHTHTNPSKIATNEWYLLALSPVTGQTAPSLPNQKTIYKTSPLPTSVFSKGAYCEKLLKTELQPNGRTASLRHSGLEMLHVLDGSVKVDIAGQDAKTLNTGESTHILPNTPVQVSNAGSNVAHFLSFNAWSQGQAFSEDLSGLPAEIGTPVPTTVATKIAPSMGTVTSMETATPAETVTPTESAISTGITNPAITPVIPTETMNTATIPAR